MPEDTFTMKRKQPGSQYICDNRISLQDGRLMLEETVIGVSPGVGERRYTDVTDQVAALLAERIAQISNLKVTKPKK